jgi:hypothetical protein
MRDVSGQTFYRKSKHTFCVRYFFYLLFPGNRAFLFDNVEKNMFEPDRLQLVIKHGAFALRAAYLRLPNTHSQIIKYMLPFFSSSGYANEPRCYVIHTVPDFSLNYGNQFYTLSVVSV